MSYEIKGATKHPYRETDDRQNKVYGCKVEAHLPGYIESEDVPDSRYARTHLFNSGSGAAKAIINLAGDLVMAKLAEPFVMSSVGREDVHRYDDNEYPEVDKIRLDEPNPLCDQTVFTVTPVKKATLGVHPRIKENRFTDTPEDTYEFTFTLTFKVRTEKPSDTPTKERMMQVMTTRGSSGRSYPTSGAAIDHAANVQKERVEHHIRVTQATNCAETMADFFRDEGKEKVDYKERLEALKEERDEAIRSTAEQYKEDCDVESLAEEWDVAPEAVEAALENWNDFLSMGGFGRGYNTPDRMDPSLVD
jgi:hypothetical protein